MTKTACEIMNFQALLPSDVSEKMLTLFLLFCHLIGRNSVQDKFKQSDDNLDE